MDQATQSYHPTILNRLALALFAIASGVTAVLLIVSFI
jgi:hypothetical protein